MTCRRAWCVLEKDHDGECKPEDYQLPVTEEQYVRHCGPMHTWFSLSYSSYLVLPRTFIQEMPTEWQERLVRLLREMDATLDVGDPPGGYRVNCLDERGKFTEHEWNDYRRGPFPALKPRVNHDQSVLQIAGPPSDTPSRVAGDPDAVLYRKNL